DEAQRLADHADDMSNLHLWVDDAPGITMAEIRAKARRLARERPLGLMVMDYIGLISAVGKVESRQIEIAQYSRALKMLAKELDCPVVVVVQLSRQAEMNGAPRLHHL
ncbi:DnaB-like helicase C-terminal domain-containing protein, partial [Streptococcus pyogenes]